MAAMRTSGWQDLLREASSVEEFEKLKMYIDFDLFRTVFANITSPVVLQACICHMRSPSYRWFEEKLCEMFYVVGRTYHIDLMEVFFEYTTWDAIALEKMELTSFLKDVTTEGAVDVVVFLLEKGMFVDIILRNSLWRIPFLTWACSQGKIDIVKLLLERGANVNMLNRRGETSAFSAMKCGDVRVLDHLIMHGIDVYRHNDEGESLWFAVHPSNYRKELQENFQRLADMRVPIDVKMYKEKFLLLKESHRLKMKAVLDIMRGVLESQGVVFTEWGSIVSEGTE